VFSCHNRKCLIRPREMEKMNNKKQEVVIRNGTAEFLIFAYQSKGDGVEVRVQDGTIWLSQKNMGLLFDTSSDNVGLHLKKYI